MEILLRRRNVVKKALTKERAVELQQEGFEVISGIEEEELKPAANAKGRRGKANTKDAPSPEVQNDAPPQNEEDDNKQPPVQEDDNNNDTSTTV